MIIIIIIISRMEDITQMQFLDKEDWLWIQKLSIMMLHWLEMLLIGEGEKCQRMWEVILEVFKKKQKKTKSFSQKWKDNENVRFFSLLDY